MQQIHNRPRFSILALPLEAFTVLTVSSTGVQLRLVRSVFYACLVLVRSPMLHGPVRYRLSVTDPCRRAPGRHGPLGGAERLGEEGGRLTLADRECMCCSACPTKTCLPRWRMSSSGYSCRTSLLSSPHRAGCVHRRRLIRSGPLFGSGQCCLWRQPRIRSAGRGLVACTVTGAHDAVNRGPCSIWNERGTSFSQGS
jgi:hypothetical protein